MAIGRITGPMLVRNLERQGVDLSVEGNLIYFNVTDKFVGISEEVPTYVLHVSGNVFAGNTLTVGYENNPQYTLPFYSAPNTGSILVSGNISSLPHDVLWSNVLIIDQERRLVGIDKNPNYKLDVNGNVFAGNTLTVGYENNPQYTLPFYSAPNTGSILVSGNISSLPHDMLWSNVLIIDQERRLVGIDKNPNYKLDVFGNVFAGDGLIVGKNDLPIYQLPEAPGDIPGSVLVSGNLTELNTYWTSLLVLDRINRLVGVDIQPNYKLHINGNVFAGNTLTVGYENNPQYTLPFYSAPNTGSILVSGNISSQPHDVLWSNVLIIDQERRLVGIDRQPQYKLDIAGNLNVDTDANVNLKLWVGERITVGDHYHLPTTTPRRGQYLTAIGGILSETVWSTGPEEILVRRRRYCKVIENLPGYGNVEFTMNLGVTNIVYNLSVNRPVKVEVFSTPEKNEPNPYTFIGTMDHLVDDGTVYLNDGSSYQSRQYSIFANLEDPPKNTLYVTVTSIDQHLANTPVVISLWYYPAILDSGSNRVRFGTTPPTPGVDGGEFFFDVVNKNLYIYYDGVWQLV